VLGIRGTSAPVSDADRPVVFVGPYEHHSNELPWRESIADLVVMGEDADGRLDLQELREQLERFSDRRLKIGSFSAASNVSGVITDALAVAMLLHRFGALSLWDYAAAGPYLKIEMNPDAGGRDGHLAYKDAVFLSPHKFIGGPGTPGVLVAKRRLFGNRIPTMPGGGTVTFVSISDHAYHDAIEDGGGRHSRDRRLDSRGPRLSAQGIGGTGHDPQARGRVRAPRNLLLASQSQHRDRREPRSRPTFDHLGGHPPRAGDAAPPLRRLSAQ
jgi:Aminotransferase class-V